MPPAPVRKPPHGAPCNRCGLCCKANICPFGVALFKRQRGPCPALEETETGFACGVIVRPADFARVRTLMHGTENMRRGALLLIGAGDGCDAVADDETRNDAYYQKLVEIAKTTRAEAKQARKLWGV